MFYVDTVGTASVVNAAINAMTSTGGAVEAAMLASMKTMLTTAVTNLNASTGYNSGNFQVQVRGEVGVGTTQVSFRINCVEVDNMGNVRMGSPATRANVFTP